ncbi:hypothetical protein BC826DRAFT_995980 [Russula brevipes]|nr:hypothetical protein BC826DRAFT_995980 [Russula brevipes]
MPSTVSPPASVSRGCKWTVSGSEDSKIYLRDPQSREVMKAIEFSHSHSLFVLFSKTFISFSLLWSHSQTFIFPISLLFWLFILHSVTV